jgi:hypothetical protein
MGKASFTSLTSPATPRRRVPMLGLQRSRGATSAGSFAVLHMGAIKSPQDAVRAAIVAEHRSANG